jgi:demethylmenaquinone methyltransferase / 2-methoxy-6-polyprenyl-1,4-benzoquinol methylase
MLVKDNKNIDFGYKIVKKKDKQNLVNNVFNSVADKYDLMNDITSLGIHREWKNNLINWMAPQKNQKLADIAGGTGDIAGKFLNNGGHSAYVIDINEEMIKSGKVNKKNLKNIKWLVASAEDIPINDNTFERATMGFGLRNVTNRAQALKEVYRILKPGGRFICLEFSHVENELIEEIYNFWSFKCMPYIGEKVAGDRSAYTYLVESIRQFPTQPELSEMFSEAGFSRVKYRNLSNGIVSLHSGWKL